ncbi:hypothetical protein QE197_14410 [Arsenophonus nasoniae]|nr:hypothetical protein [Arsenophonus nasoniae]WGM00882.1 hypothetical protein QE210_13645 [Arsenophonus nasoniae]WGM04928.1 hypothetical protein QE258_15255 [Arsenophonus nasoniae]WGM10026.1 hypothetical protein QE197_14410 [Arsenophonus nasoniae]WGM14741.1 hypothetical protein QE193_14325 [Arsenophonus nasoniae]
MNSISDRTQEQLLKELKLLHQLTTIWTQRLTHAKAEITKFANDFYNVTKRWYVKVVCKVRQYYRHQLR